MNFLAACLLSLVGDGTDYASLLKDAKLNLAEALDKGTAEAKTGFASWVMINRIDGKVVFEVDVTQGPKTVEMTLDAKEGKVVTSDTDEDEDAEAPKEPKLTLKKAVELALKQVDGKAVEAELLLDDGQQDAYVKVFADGQVYMVVVDGDKGAVAGVKRISDQDMPGQDAPKEAQDGSGIAWIQVDRAAKIDDPFKVGLEKARQEKKPIVLFTFDDDDSPFLDTDDAFKDKALKEFKDKFIFVKVDSESPLLREKAREAYDNAPWVFVLDSRADEPFAKPLVKIHGEHKKGGGIPVDKLKDAMTEGLKKNAEVKQ